MAASAAAAELGEDVGGGDEVVLPRGYRRGQVAGHELEAAELAREPSHLGLGLDRGRRGERRPRLASGPESGAGAASRDRAASRARSQGARSGQLAERDPRRRVGRGQPGGRVGEDVVARARDGRRGGAAR